MRSVFFISRHLGPRVWLPQEHTDFQRRQRKVLYLQRLRASRGPELSACGLWCPRTDSMGCKERRAYCPPSWIVPLYWVMRRAIRLNELPVQNRRPRTRTTLPLLTVPKRLSVFGCWNTWTVVCPESRATYDDAGRVRSNVAAPPEPATKFDTVPVIACCCSLTLSATIVPAAAGTAPALSTSARCPALTVVPLKGKFGVPGIPP